MSFSHSACVYRSLVLPKNSIRLNADGFRCAIAAVRNLVRGRARQRRRRRRRRAVADPSLEPEWNPSCSR